MFIVPVIDLQRGVAVHGRAGERDTYRPVSSVLTASADPVDLARAYRVQLGLHQVYLADLDAIAGADPAWDVHRSLVELGSRLWLDAGSGEPQQVDQIARRLAGDVDLVIGLETLASRHAVVTALESLGPARTVVSLDMDSGRPRTPDSAWQSASAVQVARDLLELGVTRLILLDIRRVGMGQGTGTDELVRQLRADGCTAQLVCGGGVRTADDVLCLVEAGCDGLLLATALHEGRIGRCEIACWQQQGG